MVTARKPMPDPQARIRALTTHAIGLTNEALDIFFESRWGDPDPENQLDDLLRARASLLRVLATPEQVEAEFREALARLGDDDYGVALKAHVVELAFASDRVSPGRLLVPDGVNPDHIGKDLALVRRASKAVR